MSVLSLFFIINGIGGSIGICIGIVIELYIIIRNAYQKDKFQRMQAAKDLPRQRRKEEFYQERLAYFKNERLLSDEEAREKALQSVRDVYGDW